VSKKNRTAAYMLLAALMVIFMVAAPAFAAAGDGPGKAKGRTQAEDKRNSDGSKANRTSDRDGDADSDTNTAYTEDNDRNDGGTPNNVEDDGDNRHPSGKDRSVESSNQGKAGSDPDDDGRGPDRSNGGPDKPNGSGGVDKADQDGNNGCGNDDDFEDDNEGLCGGNRPEKTHPCDDDATMPGTQPCVLGGQTPCDADATMAGTQPCDDEKVTICHATGSMTNPYVMITVSANGLNGHGDHEGDIIPAPADGVCGAAVAGASTSTVAGDVAASSPPGIEAAEQGDAVKGLFIGRDGDNVVAAAQERGVQRAPEGLGAALPFTGASLASVIAVALGLIAAGVFAVKVRKTS